MSRYKITMTDNQLRVVRVALEEYFRLRMGQDYDFSSDLAAINVDLSQDNPNHKLIFDRYIERRDHMQEVLKAFFRIAFEPQGYLEKKTDDMLIAEDIWDQIRVTLGLSRWKSALHVSTEPLPEIEVTE